MKKILIALLFICASAPFLQAQYEPVFGDESTSWNLFILGAGWYKTECHELTSDTIINDTSYHVTVSSIGQYFFLREQGDSMVFLINPRLSDKEMLTYDITLEKGDSFMVGRYLQDTIVVDTVFIENGRKIIEFDYEITFYAFEEKLRFIEGVGSNFSLFYQGYPSYMIDDELYLLCSYKNDTLAFSNQSFDGQCEVSWNALEEFAETSVKIYPNPATDIITIDNLLDDQVTDICIYNSSGILLEVIPIEHDSSQINIEHLEHGIYFLVCQSANQLVKPIKLFVL